MVTPDYARAYIDELQRMAPRRRSVAQRPSRPSSLTRLVRRLAR